MISWFLRTADGLKVCLTMFIFPRPLLPVAAALGLLLLLVCLSLVSGG